MKEGILQQRFVELYQTQVDAVFRFCLFRIADREVALDLTEDTFTRFWQTLRDGRVYGNEKALLFITARHLIIDWYRRKKSLSLESLTGSAGIESFPAPDATWFEGELQAEGRYLLSKISELDPIYQQVVYLRFVEDLRPQEIASILGESPNTISVRINRGIAELKKLTGYDINE